MTVVAILYNISISPLEHDKQGGDTKFAGRMTCSVRAEASRKAQWNNLPITSKLATKRATLIQFPQTQANTQKDK